MEEKFVDLHMHSTFSDGNKTPTELVNECVRLGYVAMALTDHDSWLGVAEAQAAAHLNGDKIKVIPGVELDTRYEGKAVHVLGYYIDTSNKELKEAMDMMRLEREKRLQLTLARLRELGYFVEIKDCDPKNKAVGRPHVAKALVEKHYFHLVQEAFDVLLAAGKPAYVPMKKMTPQEAVKFIQAAGGVAFLAHPGEIKDTTMPERLLENIAFDGLEVWHPNNRDANDKCDKWLALARKHNLMTSGGSDFHAIKGKYPDDLGIFKVAYADVRKLVDLR